MFGHVAVGNLAELGGEMDEDFLAPSSPVVRSADVAIAQIETPYTDRGEVSVFSTSQRARPTPTNSPHSLTRGSTSQRSPEITSSIRDIPAFVTPSTPYTDVASSQPARE